MPSLGVNVAIVQAGKVLLTQREDFEVWCLPGGGMDAGESVAQAALREAYEETGFEVELTRLVGIYSRPHWHEDGSHIVVFAARPVGGRLRPQPGEVINAGFFGPDELPHPLLFGQRRRLEDLFSGAAGVVWSQGDVWPWPRNLPRQELYALRDRSGLSRQDFYLQAFCGLDGENHTLELPPVYLGPLP